jgi:hypothetical protein
MAAVSEVAVIGALDMGSRCLLMVGYKGLRNSTAENKQQDNQHSALRTQI